MRRSTLFQNILSKIKIYDIVACRTLGSRAPGPGPEVGRAGRLGKRSSRRLVRKPRPTAYKKSAFSPWPYSSPTFSSSPTTTPTYPGRLMLTCSPSSATDPPPFRPLALQRGQRERKLPLQIYVAGAPPCPLAQPQHSSRSYPSPKGNGRAPVLACAFP